MNIIFVALRFFLFLTLLTGIIYPLFITAIAQFAFPHKSKGSLVTSKELVVGSEWIAQPFTSDKYFWPRPSAVNYNPLPSGGSNLGPTSAKLAKEVDERATLFKSASSVIPAELLFTSGSGLDPHITPEGAYFQAERVAKARGIAKNDVEAIIEKQRQTPLFGTIGPSTVNVLLLNIELDNQFAK